ncbi:sigma 54-interacting transcriptional regulator [Bacillus sp. B-jedd]|uniref:sigma 54-interacting transcriptional regulator n=1 Tax=Bacillus sp. B-jedd TaxID=1476857 RepID=UPI000662A2EF|nr:sigma 54-interacting transcriptional regulator [Bacillus sp. B-jedd]
MIKIALVVPCSNFIKDAFDIFNEHNFMEENRQKYTYQLEEVVISEENPTDTRIQADVIITRGLLAEILKRVSGDIPIVEIPVSSTDILRTIRRSTEKYGTGTIGVIAANNMLAGLKELYDLLDAPVKTYRLNTTWNGFSLVKEAIADGCQIILGGIKTCKYADDLNLNNMFIESSREAFWQAITQAKITAATAIKEQEKANRLQAILETASDGVIVVNAERELVMLNPKAAYLLDLDKSIIGQKLDTTSILPKFRILMQDTKEYTNEVFRYKKTMLSINKRFIKVKNVVSDIVFNIQAVQDLQLLEGSIRKRIYSKGHTAHFNFSQIVAESEMMKQTIETAKHYSRTNSNILLIGESGTGKEVFAQSIHRESDRFSQPFVAINCAAIPDNLLESELFGYVAGSFTGANKNGKAGLFEIAHRGTIFLDEIAEIPLSLQAKLLRVLQEREIMRLGSDVIIKVDIRIIGATNKDLEVMVKENKFREDLFYRLDVLRIEIPNLEMRKEDIPFLVDDYFRKNYPGIELSHEAKLLLMQHSWPGNVRQLFNICERLAVLYAPRITSEAIQTVLPNTINFKKTIETENRATPPDERERVLQALIDNQYNRSLAARSLGISRSTLWRKMKDYHIAEKNQSH